MYDFVKCVIQPTIQEFYVEEKTSQTIPNLLLKLMDRINFKGSSTNMNCEGTWILMGENKKKYGSLDQET